MLPTWINRRRGTLMLLDIRIRLVDKPYREVGQETIKRCKTELWNVVSRSSLSDNSEPFVGYISTVSHSTDLLGFLKDVQEAPVYLSFQCVLVYLLLVVSIAPFHASLPTLEMLLGFLPGEVRCQILYVFKHKRSLPMLLLFSFLKLPLQPGLFFPFCPPTSE